MNLFKKSNWKGCRDEYPNANMCKDIYHIPCGLAYLNGIFDYNVSIHIYIGV